MVGIETLAMTWAEFRDPHAIGVVLSVLGGLSTQMRHMSQERTPWLLVASELLSSGLLGFVTHVLAKRQEWTDEEAWCLCVFAGATCSLVFRTVNETIGPLISQWVDEKLRPWLGLKRKDNRDEHGKKD